jgi:hypothetical protein
VRLERAFPRPRDEPVVSRGRRDGHHISAGALLAAFACPRNPRALLDEADSLRSAMAAQPYMQGALQALQNARTSLETAASDKSGLSRRDTRTQTGV